MRARGSLRPERRARIWPRTPYPGHLYKRTDSESQRAHFSQTQSPFFYIDVLGKEFLSKSLLVFLVGGSLVLAYHSSMVRRALLLNFIPILVTAFFYSSAPNMIRQTFLGKIELHLFFYVQNVLLTILAF